MLNDTLTLTLTLYTYTLKAMPIENKPVVKLARILMYRFMVPKLFQKTAKNGYPIVLGRQKKHQKWGTPSAQGLPNGFGRVLGVPDTSRTSPGRALGGSWAALGPKMSPT